MSLFVKSGPKVALFYAYTFPCSKEGPVIAGSYGHNHISL